jgi:hypothetical protein
MTIMSSPVVSVKARFDGKVLIPDEPLDLPRNQPVLIRIEPLAATGAALRGVQGKSLLRFAGAIDRDDLRQMEEAIREGCERVDPNGW